MVLNNSLHFSKITLPENLEIIGKNVFDGCSSLEQISIPSKVKVIGRSSFEVFTSLKEIKFPRLVNIFNYRTFKECTSLEKVTFLCSTIELIGDYAFYGCSSINELSFYSPNKTYNSSCSIGYRAFEGCSSLSKVTFGPKIDRIENYAFKRCSSFTKFETHFEDCLSLIEVFVSFFYKINRKQCFQVMFFSY